MFSSVERGISHIWTSSLHTFLQVGDLGNVSQKSLIYIIEKVRASIKKNFKK